MMGPLVLGAEEITYFFSRRFWVARAVWPEPLQFAPSCWNVRDCLHGSPQPTALAPAQVWPGPDLGFLVDFYAVGYTKTNRADGRQDYHWRGLLGPQDWAVLVRHASAVSCGRPRGWNWCGWKTDFRRGPVAATIGPWRAAGGTR